MIAVSDSGIGIVPQDFQHIFNPFDQARGDNARLYEGTGLGLALVQQFVAMHGGVIWVASEGRDRGSTFTFTLPSTLALREAQTASAPTSENVTGSVDLR